MRIGLRAPACRPLPEMADLARRAETAGFDVLWVPDSQLLWGDVWAVLGAMAGATGAITLGTNVTNPVTRDATVTAGASATMLAAAPGRFVLGIGVGDSSVRVMGRRPARMAELSHYVDEVRSLLTGETVDRHGKGYRLVEPPGEQAPVYVSATGPKMLQLAGEIADGVIFVGGIDRQALDYARENIALGAARAGRPGDGIDLAVGCFCHVGDIEHGKRLMRPYAAVFALRHPDLLGEFDVTPPGPEASLGFYPDLGHARDWEAAIEHTAWVPDPLLDVFCDRYCLIGDGPAIRSRVGELEALGVDNLYVRGVHSYELPEDVLSGLAEHVIA